MRQEKVSTLTDILAQGRLGGLRERSCHLNRLDTLLSFYLDGRLRPLIQVAAYQDETLTLACANSTVAGQLRYLGRIYIQQLRQHDELRALKRIRAVTLPATSVILTPKTTRPPLKKLSPTTAGLLLSLSDGLGGGELSEALRQLARHV
jgi:hypothetical protein